MAVKKLLAEESARFELELSKKETEFREEEVATCVASYMNFVAAETALQALQNSRIDSPLA